MINGHARGNIRGPYDAIGLHPHKIAKNTILEIFYGYGINLQLCFIDPMPNRLSIKFSGLVMRGDLSRF